MMFMVMDKEEFPDIKEQGKSLAKFTVSVVKSAVINTGTDSSVFISKDKQKERWDICKVCEHYSKNQKRCKKCGCWLEYKIKFNASSCPIDKW